MFKGGAFLNSLRHILHLTSPFCRPVLAVHANTLHGLLLQARAMVAAAQRGGPQATIDACEITLQILKSGEACSDPLTAVPPASQEWWSIMRFLARLLLRPESSDRIKAGILRFEAHIAGAMLAAAMPPPEGRVRPGLSDACAAATRASVVWHAAVAPRENSGSAALAAAAAFLQAPQRDVRLAAAAAVAEVITRLVARGDEPSHHRADAAAAQLLRHVSRDPDAHVRATTLAALSTILGLHLRGAAVDTASFQALFSEATPATAAALAAIVEEEGVARLHAAEVAAYLLAGAAPAFQPAHWLPLMHDATLLLAFGPMEKPACRCLRAVFECIGPRLLAGEGIPATVEATPHAVAMAQAQACAALLRLSQHDDPDEAVAASVLVTRLCGCSVAEDRPKHVVELTRLGCVEAVARSVWQCAPRGMRLHTMICLVDALVLDGLLEKELVDSGSASPDEVDARCERAAMNYLELPFVGETLADVVSRTLGSTLDEGECKEEATHFKGIGDALRRLVGRHVAGSTSIVAASLGVATHVLDACEAVAKGTPHVGNPRRLYHLHTAGI
jgi:hypothetical protein